MAAPAGYLYYRLLTITNNANNTDYQVKLDINTQDLVDDGKMQADGKDIRFQDSDNTTNLSYWIESGMNSEHTIIWVKVPTLVNGTKDIYFYYGNPSETTAGSDGEDTFIFFDDFPGTSVNTTKWPNHTGNQWVVSSSILQHTQSEQSALYTNQDKKAAPVAWRARASFRPSVAGDKVNMIMLYTGSYYDIGHYSNYPKWTYYAGGWSSYNTDYSTGYHIVEVRRTSATTMTAYVDGASIGSRIMASDTAQAIAYIYTYGDSWTGTTGVDWFLVRNCQGTEPTYEYGGEQVTALNIKINIGDVWKDVTALKINIGDVWKEVDSQKINIGDVWKTI